MVTTIRREITTETIEPEPQDTSYDPILRKALESKNEAEAALKNTEAGRIDPDGGGMFCCMYHKKNAVNHAKKHLKQINDWLAVRAGFAGGQLELDLDEDDGEFDDDDPTEGPRFFRAG